MSGIEQVFTILICAFAAFGMIKSLAVLHFASGMYRSFDVMLSMPAVVDKVGARRVDEETPEFIAEYSAVRVMWIPIAYMSFFLLLMLTWFVVEGITLPSGDIMTIFAALTIPTVMVKGMFYAIPPNVREFLESVEKAYNAVRLELLEKAKAQFEQLNTELAKVDAVLREEMAKQQSPSETKAD